MLRLQVLVGLFLLILFFIPKSIFAESGYVLPYPSAMPGSIFYKLNLVQEEILKYWYFGDLGKYHYNLKQSDKYLVEAKTLFEYGQYLLGTQALSKSDDYFKKIKPFLKKAEANGKNVSEKLTVLDEAAKKHIEVLQKLKSDVPGEIEWVPEKEKPTMINTANLFSKSIKLREQ